MAALISAGSITLVSLPQAAILYVGFLTIGCATLTLKLGSPSMFGLVIDYAGDTYLPALPTIARELETTGSAGLWELDGDLRIANMSGELLAAMRLREEQVIGLHYKTFLDPLGQIATLSSGMRSLFEDLDDGMPFRDRAILSADPCSRSAPIGESRPVPATRRPRLRLR